MSATVREIRMEVVPDQDPDTSYLEQEGWEDRLKQYQDGDFGFVGVRAVAELVLNTGAEWSITQTIESPGLWGIEDDSGEDYYKSVYEDELSVLRDMLKELGVKDA